jgi:hypothetical protein
MNKLFIGLLIIAAGAGVYFLLRKKENQKPLENIKKEDILGKWKTDPALLSKDSNEFNYTYDFRNDGMMLVMLNDSTKADTSHYSLSKNNQLVWKEKQDDSTGMVFSVLLLDKDSLQLQAKDSTKILLIRAK